MNGTVGDSLDERFGEADVFGWQIDVRRRGIVWGCCRLFYDRNGWEWGGARSWDIHVVVRTYERGPRPSIRKPHEIGL
jgi:hypothetical protein